MKLLFNAATRTVKYFGNDINIEENDNYLAVDSDGELWAHICKPTLLNDHWGESAYPKYLGNVDLEGMDWKETLMYVGDL